MFENPRRAGKQKSLQQMFRKFEILNHLLNRYFPKIDVGCPWTKEQRQEMFSYMKYLIDECKVQNFVALNAKVATDPELKRRFLDVLLCYLKVELKLNVTSGPWVVERKSWIKMQKPLLKAFTKNERQLAESWRKSDKCETTEVLGSSYMCAYENLYSKESWVAFSRKKSWFLSYFVVVYKS